jgi:hypothetical protein
MFCSNHGPGFRLVPVWLDGELFGISSLAKSHLHAPDVEQQALMHF